MNTKPITISDRPDARVVGSALGDVTWQQWCQAERIRLEAHGLRAVIGTNRATRMIHVAVVVPKGGRK